jgi:polyphosphate kinase 2 (PPK2 family)
VAHILPFEDAGPQTLVTRSYFSPQEIRPASKQAGPTPRKPERTMSKKSKNKKKRRLRLDSNTQPSGVNGQQKIGKKDYEAEIFKLQVELVKLQDWVKATNASSVFWKRPQRLTS